MLGGRTQEEEQPPRAILGLLLLLLLMLTVTQHTAPGPRGPMGSRARWRGTSCAPNSSPAPGRLLVPPPSWPWEKLGPQKATDLSKPQCQAVPRLGDDSEAARLGLWGLTSHSYVGSFGSSMATTKQPKKRETALMGDSDRG